MESSAYDIVVFVLLNVQQKLVGSFGTIGLLIRELVYPSSKITLNSCPLLHGFVGFS